MKKINKTSELNGCKLNDRLLLRRNGNEYKMTYVCPSPNGHIVHLPPTDCLISDVFLNNTTSELYLLES